LRLDLRVWGSPGPVPRHVFIEEARMAQDIFALLKDRVDGDLLDASPGLRVVANMAVGYDNIDVAGCTRREISSPTPGVLTETTADLAFTLSPPPGGWARSSGACAAAGGHMGPGTSPGPGCSWRLPKDSGAWEDRPSGSRKAVRLGMKVLYSDLHRNVPLAGDTYSHLGSWHYTRPP
jgi:glyoxylate reductase